MIKFHDLPVQPEAVENLTHAMKSFGFSQDDAERLVEIALAIALAMLRGMDEKITSQVTNDLEQTVVQQLVLQQLSGSAIKGMETNAIETLMRMTR